MAQAFLELKHVHKWFKRGDTKLKVLQDVNFSLSLGEFVAVMGPSGAGKTTLLQLIAGLDVVSQGTIRVNNYLLSTLSEADLTRLRHENIGVAFQFFDLISSLKVLENVALPLIIARVPRQQAMSQALDILNALGVADLADTLPELISGGEKQRVAIARALVTKPKLLLADEPTGSLDSVEAEKLLHLFDQLRKEQGLSILMVTHSARVAAYADRILSLRQGQLASKQMLGSHA